VRDWARTLPRGAAVIDLGCGSGLPITKVLVSEDLNVYAIDASPSLVEAYEDEGQNHYFDAFKRAPTNRER